MTPIYHLIQQQIPVHIQQQNPLFCKFIEYYYRWLQTRSFGSLSNITNIDSTITAISLKDISANKTGRNDISVFLNHTISNGEAIAEVVSIDDNDRIIVRYLTADAKFNIGDNIHIRPNSADYYTNDQANELDTAVVSNAETLPSAFIDHFSRMLDADQIFGTDTPNITTILRHIRELYQSKGNEQALKYLIKALKGVEAEIKYPWDNVLKFDDGKWKKEYCVTVRGDERYWHHVPTTMRKVRVMYDELDASGKQVYKDWPITKVEIFGMRHENYDWDPSMNPPEAVYDPIIVKRNYLYGFMEKDSDGNIIPPSHLIPHYTYIQYTVPDDGEHDIRYVSVDCTEGQTEISIAPKNPPRLILQDILVFVDGVYLRKKIDADDEDYHYIRSRDKVKFKAPLHENSHVDVIIFYGNERYISTRVKPTAVNSSGALAPITLGSNIITPNNVELFVNGIRLRYGKTRADNVDYTIEVLENGASAIVLQRTGLVNYTVDINFYKDASINEIVADADDDDSESTQAQETESVEIPAMYSYLSMYSEEERAEMEQTGELTLLHRRHWYYYDDHNTASNYVLRAAVLGHDFDLFSVEDNWYDETGPYWVRNENPLDKEQCPKDAHGEYDKSSVFYGGGEMVVDPVSGRLVFDPGLGINMATYGRWGTRYITPFIRLYFEDDIRAHINQEIIILNDDGTDTLYKGNVVDSISDLGVVQPGKHWQVGQVFTANKEAVWRYYSASQKQPDAPGMTYYNKDGICIEYSVDKPLIGRVLAVDKNGGITSVEIIQYGDHVPYDGSKEIIISPLFYHDGSDESEYNAVLKLNYSTIASGAGSFAGTSGFLSYNSIRIQDGYYYQQFAYDIVAPVDGIQYQDIAKLLHPAGTKMFTTYNIEADLDAASDFDIDQTYPYIAITLFDVCHTVETIAREFKKSITGDNVDFDEFLEKFFTKTLADTVSVSDGHHDNVIMYTRDMNYDCNYDQYSMPYTDANIRLVYIDGVLRNMYPKLNPANVNIDDTLKIDISEYNIDYNDPTLITALGYTCENSQVQCYQFTVGSDSSTVSFNGVQPGDLIHVFVGGLMMDNNDYTLNGTTLTLKKMGDGLNYPAQTSVFVMVFSNVVAYKDEYESPTNSQINTHNCDVNHLELFADGTRLINHYDYRMGSDGHIYFLKSTRDQTITVFAYNNLRVETTSYNMRHGDRSPYMERVVEGTKKVSYANSGVDKLVHINYDYHVTGDFLDPLDVSDPETTECVIYTNLDSGIDIQSITINGTALTQNEITRYVSPLKTMVSTNPEDVTDAYGDKLIVQTFTEGTDNIKAGRRKFFRAPVGANIRYKFVINNPYHNDMDYADVISSIGPVEFNHFANNDGNVNTHYVEFVAPARAVDVILKSSKKFRGITVVSNPDCYIDTDRLSALPGETVTVTARAVDFQHVIDGIYVQPDNMPVVQLQPTNIDTSSNPAVYTYTFAMPVTSVAVYGVCSSAGGYIRTNIIGGGVVNWEKGTERNNPYHIDYEPVDITGYIEKHTLIGFDISVKPADYVQFANCRIIDSEGYTVPTYREYPGYSEYEHYKFDTEGEPPSNVSPSRILFEMPDKDISIDVEYTPIMYYTSIENITGTITNGIYNGNIKARANVKLDPLPGQTAAGTFVVARNTYFDDHSVVESIKATTKDINGRTVTSDIMDNPTFEVRYGDVNVEYVIGCTGGVIGVDSDIGPRWVSNILTEPNIGSWIDNEKLINIAFKRIPGYVIDRYSRSIYDGNTAYFPEAGLLVKLNNNGEAELDADGHVIPILDEDSDFIITHRCRTIRVAMDVYGTPELNDDDRVIPVLDENNNFIYLGDNGEAYWGKPEVHYFANDDHVDRDLSVMGKYDIIIDDYLYHALDYLITVNEVYERQKPAQRPGEVKLNITQGQYYYGPHAYDAGYGYCQSDDEDASVPSLAPNRARYGSIITVNPIIHDNQFIVDKITYTYAGTTVDITESRTLSVPASDVIITVTFKRIYFNVNVIQPDSTHGVLTLQYDGASPTTYGYKEGSVITVGASPASLNYELTSLNIINEDGETIDITANKQFVVDGDITVQSTWDRVMYSVSIMPPRPSGEVSTVAAKVLKNASVDVIYENEHGEMITRHSMACSNIVTGDSAQSAPVSKIVNILVPANSSIQVNLVAAQVTDPSNQYIVADLKFDYVLLSEYNISNDVMTAKNTILQASIDDSGEIANYGNVSIEKPTFAIVPVVSTVLTDITPQIQA